MAKRPFKSGSESVWGSALKGLAQGMMTRRQLEEMAADRALKKFGAAIQLENAAKPSVVPVWNEAKKTYDYQVVPGMKSEDISFYRKQIGIDIPKIAAKPGESEPIVGKPVGSIAPPRMPAQEETPQLKQARTVLESIQSQQARNGVVDIASANSAKAYGDLLGWDVQVNPVAEKQPGSVARFFGAEEKPVAWATITVTPRVQQAPVGSPLPGASSVPSPLPRPTPPPIQTPESYLQSIGAKITPANIEWAKRKLKQ